MIDKTVILKSIDDAIIKCPATGKAKKIGASCVITTEENNRGYDNHIYSYEDGTSLTFDDNYNLMNISFDGVDYPYYNDDEAYEKFDYQKQSLMNTVDGGKEPTDFLKELGVESDWETLLEFTDDFASVNGWILNGEMRKGIDVDSVDYYNSWLDDTYALADHEWFMEIENNTLCDHENYSALRVTTKIHDNEDLSKRIDETDDELESAYDELDKLQKTHDNFVNQVQELGKNLHEDYLVAIETIEDMEREFDSLSMAMEYDESETLNLITGLKEYFNTGLGVLTQEQANEVNDVADKVSDVFKDYYSRIDWEGNDDLIINSIRGLADDYNVNTNPNLKKEFDNFEKTVREFRDTNRAIQKLERNIDKLNRDNFSLIENRAKTQARYDKVSS